MASKDGCRRITRKAKENIISSLPDEVLSHILSLLRTKCAVGTSILSKRWKYLWTCITSLQFHFEGPTTMYDDSDFEDLEDFTNFVDHVFRNCSSSYIQTFCLQFRNDRVNKNHVTGWIDEVIKRNISLLDVDVYGLPSSVFSCRTFTALTFAAYSELDTNIVLFDLPCLKVLHIKRGCVFKDFMEKLISSCPVLEDLTLAGYLGYEKAAIFMVSSTSLKILRLQLYPDIGGGYTNKISVKAPNLECLYLSESFVKYSIKGDFSSVIKADVTIGDISKGRSSSE